ncbi:MAG: GNAT family N-acetyltransferase [Alphaproteobacteria bacterium]|nr:GNAT family N-acetyltransferase [Alphaproteobacteria bacterium]
MTGSRDAEPKIRAAGMADLHLLVALHARCFDDGAALGEPWDARAIAEILSMPGTFGLLADHCRTPCGLAIVRVTVDEAELLTIGVDPAHRGAGVGSALLWRALAAARSEGAKDMYLEVAESNRAAIALYVKSGFEDCGFRRGYYAARDRIPRSVSAIVMARETRDLSSPGNPGAVSAGSLT